MLNSLRPPIPHLRWELESQQAENKSVEAGFKTLNDEAGIYKLVGPVLVKQEKEEVRGVVKGKLEFTEGEM